MKQAGVITTAILFFLLGAAAFAQHDQQAKEQPGKEQHKSQPQPQKAQPQHPVQQHQPGAQPQHPVQQHQPGTQQAHPPQQHQQHPPQANKTAPAPEKPQAPYGSAYHGGVRPNGQTYGGVHHSGVPQRHDQVRSGFRESRAHEWRQDHRSWTQRGGYNGYRVPPQRFHQYWGPAHYFRVYSLPMVFVGGYPRFRYDGYWVTFVDPWPETWPDTWYETDEVYLDYTDDGYYVYNRARPGPGIAVTITF